MYIEELVRLWGKSHQPHDTEENEKERNKKEQTEKTPGEMVKIKLNRQKHKKKFTHSHSVKDKNWIKREKMKSTNGETKEKRAIKPIRKPINETNTKN